MIGLATLAAAGEQKRDTFDPFALDGASNILEERDFGIVNGKATVGVPYRNVLP